VSVPEAGDEDITIGSLGYLLRAVEAHDPAELESIVEDAAYFDMGWIDWDRLPEEVLVVCVGSWGVELSYPFKLSEFWTAVNDLDWQARCFNEWAAIAESVALTEGFGIRVSKWEDFDNWPKPDEWPEYLEPEYPYKRPAPGTWTVAEWTARRFDRRYPGYEVEVMGPDGKRVRRNLQVSTLRKRWEEAGSNPWEAS
jgi:hypothetical protein